jgi:hypothetical protein
MIRVASHTALPSHQLVVRLSDGIQNKDFHFLYVSDDIPRVKWDEKFDREFLGRFSIAEPLLQRIMEFFSTGSFSYDCSLQGILKQETEQDAPSNGG